MDIYLCFIKIIDKNIDGDIMDHMDKDLLKLLEKTGFTEKEAKVYLSLLELGQADVSEIAKKSDLKRSIIYVLLEGLTKRGYVNEVLNKKINTYQPTDPSVILSQLKSVTKDFSDMIPILKTLNNKGDNRPKITYLETKEAIWNAYEEINQVKEAFFITSYERIEGHFPGAIDKWMKDFKKGSATVKGKHLVANNKFDLEVMKKYRTLGQNTRYLSDVSDFKMDFSIYGNKLAITSLENKPFAVVIESAGLVDSLKPIFEIAWSQGKEIK